MMIAIWYGVRNPGEISDHRPAYDDLLTLTEAVRQQIRVRLAQGRLPAIVGSIYKTHRGEAATA
jgi:hypothetical protein